MGAILIAGLASLLISIFLGPKYIQFLRDREFGQHIREEGPAEHHVKAGTPTMGGLVIFTAIGVPYLILSDRDAASMAVFGTALASAGIGFADDYLKIVKARSLGLSARTKLALQLLIAIGLWVVAREVVGLSETLQFRMFDADIDIGGLYVVLIFLVIAGATNGVNLTDGLDGLAAGCVAIVLLTYTAIAFITGGQDGLSITEQDGLSLLGACLVGATIGFLWFNSFPAAIFMGDTGSLGLGGAIAGMAVMTKSEVLLIVIGGIFVIEALSVAAQVIAFRLFRRRVLLMAPVHHHFELLGWSETKIMVRFWITAAIASAIGFTLYRRAPVRTRSRDQTPRSAMAHPRPPLPPGPYLVVGLARSGVAAALALAAARPGERVVAVDAGRPPEALAEREGLERAGVEVHLESDGTQALEASPPPATLVKSPGVPQDAPVVARARSAGLEVIGELELGWRLVPNEFIAVTGTNGKTTTVELIGAMHRAAGVPVAVAGNVGTPVSSLAGAVDPAATIVCEASSFQLEDSVAFAPEVAVLLNIAPDHIDRHGTLANYRDAKLRIFANQEPPDVAIVASDVDMPPLPVTTVRFADSEDIALPGRHNQANAGAAVAVAMQRGLDPVAIGRTLHDFRGVPHRFETVAEIGGVTYVNDSKATNPSAAAAAIGSFDSGVHAILGGSLKGGSFEGLPTGPIEVAYLVGEAADRIADALHDVEIVRSGDLEHAVLEAARRARPGDVVLLAPACASFDQYRDYEERGEHFKSLVRGLSQ